MSKNKSKEINTMIHNGPIFPEDYDVKGFSLANEKLSPLAEEMLWHFSAKRDTDYMKMPSYVENTYKCLKPELTVNQQKLKFPEDFKQLVDDMFNKNQQLKETKAAAKPKKVTKKELKLAQEENDPALLARLNVRQAEYDKSEAEKAALKEKYGVAVLNGKPQPLGSFMVEGPGQIMTRGDSNIIGMWKYRVGPEDVIINFIPLPAKEWDKLPKTYQDVILGKAEMKTLSNADQEKLKEMNIPFAPRAPEGHKWKDVIVDRHSHQTAMYFVPVGRPEFNIAPRYKRVIFGSNSDVKSNADQHKFEKARKLVENWDGMEKHIKSGLASKDEKRMQCATIASLIQTTGIRVGGDKQENAGYADTQGVSTFKVSNLQLIGDNKIKLDFLGKDSVPYVNTVEIDSTTYNNLSKLMIGKKPEDKIFSVTATHVGDFLGEFMEECTAKLFRTAYGCKLISEELHKAEKEGKLTKSMSESEKLHIYDLANLAVAKKLNHQRALPKNFDAQMEKLDEKVEAAIKKEAETKAKAEKDLASILEQANLAKKEWEGEKLEQALARIKERKDKIAEKVEKSEKKLEELKTKREFKGMTACYSLTTSRTNYSTPSLAVGFCKKFGIDIGKIYSKSLLKKFDWALETPESYYTKFPKESFGDE